MTIVKEDEEGVAALYFMSSVKVKIKSVLSRICNNPISNMLKINENKVRKYRLEYSAILPWIKQGNSRFDWHAIIC